MSVWMTRGVRPCEQLVRILPHTRKAKTQLYAISRDLHKLEINHKNMNEEFNEELST